jgi:hypothetical protein
MPQCAVYVMAAVWYGMAADLSMPGTCTQPPDTGSVNGWGAQWLFGVDCRLLFAVDCDWPSRWQIFDGIDMYLFVGCCWRGALSMKRCQLGASECVTCWFVVSFSSLPQAAGGWWMHVRFSLSPALLVPAQQLTHALGVRRTVGGVGVHGGCTACTVVGVIAQSQALSFPLQVTSACQGVVGS